MNATDPSIAARIAPLLPAIYAAATDPGRWPEVLAGVVGLMQGHRGIIFTHQATPEQNGLWVLHEMREAWVREYAERFHAYDIWMQRGYSLGLFVPGNVFTSDDLLPRDEFLASVFYREFLTKQDIRDLCCAVLHDGREPDLPIVNIAIYRPHDRPLFDADAKALLGALARHLREASRIGFRIATLKHDLDAMQNMMDSIAPALVLLDAQGQVVSLNRPARTIIEHGDGIGLANRRLVIPNASGRGFASLLCPDGAQAPLLRLARPSGKSAYWVARVPLPPSGETPPDSRRACVALTLHDSAAAGEIDGASFARMHGLSKAETRLLGMLMAHDTLPSIAQALDLSINTVRSQLRAVLEKTGTHRQTELLRTLMTWPRKIVGSPKQAGPGAIPTTMANSSRRAAWPQA